MNITKITSVLLAALLLCGCSKTPPTVTTVFPDSEQLTVWIPEGHTDTMTAMCKGFTDLHPDKRYAFRLDEVSTEDITPQALKADDAPDVLVFPSELLPQLAAAGALQQAQRTEISCDTLALSAASHAGGVYAYPCAANVCILYYDKSLLSEGDISTLNAIMEKELPEDTENLAADLRDHGFSSALFFGAGCSVTQPQSFGESEGALAAEILSELADEDEFSPDSSEHKIKSGFARRELAAAVSYPDSAEAIASSLGKDMGAAALPAVRMNNGASLQPKAAASFLLISAREGGADSAAELAQWLASAENQLIRLEQQGLIPTDLSLTQDKQLTKKYPAVYAVATQLKHGTVLSSMQQKQDLCNACEQLGKALINDDDTDTQLLLQQLCETLRTRR